MRVEWKLAPSLVLAAHRGLLRGQPGERHDGRKQQQLG